MSCNIIVAVPKHRLASDVAMTVRGLRPRVYDNTLCGYRQLEFTVVERNRNEVEMTIHGVSGSDATTVWGQVSDDLYGRQLSCTLRAPMTQAA